MHHYGYFSTYYRIDSMKTKRSFLKGLRAYFTDSTETITPAPTDRLRLSGKSLRVTAGENLFAVEMGKQTVHLCPDPPVNPGLRKPPYDYVLFDPDLYYSGIAHTLRLQPGQTLAVDYREELQKLVFSHPKHAFRRHLQVTHDGDTLVFRDPISELGTYLTVLTDENEKSRYEAHRDRKLDKIQRIFGGTLQSLSSGDAIDTLKAVNRLLRKDPCRRMDSFGNAGSLVELPAHLTPIVVGDLHAKVENLLTILAANSFLECLERGEAALIFLGDAVHPEAKEELEFMESSVVTMDLIFKLKLQFPEQVFFIVGNHDSFSPDVMKGGVPQSILWEKRITALRGDEYRQEMALFYRQSPLVVLSDDFVACHAGPPRSSVTLETLVEARQFPDLVHELTWNRIKSKDWQLGYTRADIRRFRKSLNLDESMPFIVAHYPQSKDGTLWLNVNQIPQHHILYSARSDRLALFTRVGGEMLPQIYPAEAILESIGGSGLFKAQ